MLGLLITTGCGGGGSGAKGPPGIPDAAGEETRTAAAGEGGASVGAGGSGGASDASVADAAVTPAADAPTPAPDAGGADAGLQKIFDGTTLTGWTSVPPNMFKVSGGALVATGVGRGTFATDQKYGHYRILFSVKPGGTGGHAPTVLVFCLYPGKDALGGIQFQPPNGGHWDYRPGHNDAGAGFTKVGTPGPAVDGWTSCEIVANNMTGDAKMACGGKDVLHFKDPTAAGAPSPFAIQTHNPGITDAYRDISVQDAITSDDYVTAKP
jgi:hypothetical protein